MSKIYKALLRAEEDKAIKGPSPPQKDWSRDENESRGAFDDRVVTGKNSKSLAAEQFRKLKTAILEARDDGADKRCFLITSAASGEGKSMVAVNLAISMAQELDKRVLLIDGDLRRCAVDRLLGIEGKRGLSDYLSSDIELSELFHRIDSIPHLSVLPAGGSTDSAAELLSSQKMRDLAQEVKDRYHDRYIIIDSTPVMSTADAEILSREIDGIIFVVRAGMTPREIIRRSIMRLSQDRIMGVVLNDVTISRIGSRYGYYRYYGYYARNEKQG